MTWSLTACAAVWAGAALAVWWPFARRSQPIRALVAAALGLGAVVVLTLAGWGAVSFVGAPVALDPFGVVHGMYLAAVVSVPLLGAGILVLGHRAGAGRATAVLATLLLVPGVVGLYATHVAPYDLRVERRSVPVVADGSGSVRVAVLSDIQTTGVGDHERAAVAAAMAAEPDIILLPGDLFQAPGSVLRANGPELRDLLATLSAPAGVYFVEGDVDSEERLEVVLPATVTRLDDEVVSVQVRDRSVRLGGTRLAFGTPEADAVRSELRSHPEDVTILLSHRPDTVLRLAPRSGIDLTVAGHTHGGQIALPLVGPITVLSRVPRQVGAGGLHSISGNPIYVSPGVGMEREQAPQIRLGTRPTVAVLDLG